MALILNLSNSAHGPPIDGVGQMIPDPISIPTRLGPGKPAGPVIVHPQEPGSVLLVRQIREPVQTHLISPAHLVVLVNEPEIILKNLEPPVLLAQRIVRLAVFDQPRLVNGLHLGVGPLWDNPHAVFLVVVDDGHVGGGR